MILIGLFGQPACADACVPISGSVAAAAPVARKLRRVKSNDIGLLPVLLPPVRGESRFSRLVLHFTEVRPAEKCREAEHMTKVWATSAPLAAPSATKRRCFYSGVRPRPETALSQIGPSSLTNFSNPGRPM